MQGKQKCRMLREIRRRIADENDIPFVTSECTHQGECAGTCPRCESELRALERGLAARQRLGKTVTVAALCAGMVIAGAGCASLAEPTALSGDVELCTPEPEPAEEGWELEPGEVPYPEDEETAMAETDGLSGTAGDGYDIEPDGGD